MARRPSKHTRPFRPLRVEASGGQRAETRANGRWVVRSMTGAAAVKPYRCPGCHQTIPVGLPHLVVWPADPPLGASQTVTERRHWHTACWTGRR